VGQMGANGDIAPRKLGEGGRDVTITLRNLS
jgi:hypothetical protein